LRGKRVDSKRQGTIIAVDGIVAQPDARFLGCKPPTRAGLSPTVSAFMSKSEQIPILASANRELVVPNKMGIHARPAAMIVRITNKFKAEVFVEKDEEQVNGKSIMGLMMLAAGKGSKVKFIATGEDATAMLAEIEALFSRKFDEA
jgi:phosphocarrier protein HPr